MIAPFRVVYADGHQPRELSRAGSVYLRDAPVPDVCGDGSPAAWCCAVCRMPYPAWVRCHCVVCFWPPIRLPHRRDEL